MHYITATVARFLLAGFGAQNNLARKAIWRAKQNKLNESKYEGMINTVQHSMIGEGRMG